MESRMFLRCLFIFSTASLLLFLLSAYLSYSNSPPSPDYLLRNRLLQYIGRAPESACGDATPRRDHTSDIPRHPLDPLTVQEIRTARSIIASQPCFATIPIVFHSIVLDEPDKHLVLQWTEGDPIPPRKAQVVARGGGTTRVFSIDLTTNEVIVEQHDVSGYPGITVEDMVAAARAPFSNLGFNQTVFERGVKPQDVVCLPISVGWFGQEEEGRRLIKVQCYSTEGTTNFYMRPIEGLTVTVDLDSMQVLTMSDTGKDVPIPPAANTDYRFSKEKRTAVVSGQHSGRCQPFTVQNNHMIKWANWEFHLKPDPRAGMVISRVRVIDPDSDTYRDVMYKGFTSELFVPYMDPTEAWFFKTYMDAGEYGFGQMAMPLDPFNDCPKNAHFMDAVFAAGNGEPYVRHNMICLFERDAGDIGWRHTEGPIAGMMVREVRPKVTLVIRMVASVSNYDYIIDWEFQPDGVIRSKVGLSGILMVKGTKYSATTEVPTHENLYGTLISENLIGVIHDHFVTFHLDMDVDGRNNSFAKVTLQRQMTAPGGSPRKSYLKAERHVSKTEEDARVRLSLYDPAEYHVINPSKTTRLGNSVGYRLVPGRTAASLLDAADPPQIRGGFTNHQIWVTPYDRSEQWAGGLFAYQSHGDDTRFRNRRIENRDVVMWYTMGFHHIPCQEDFPIMPTVSASFDLKPANFFQRNPILDAQPYTDSSFGASPSA